MSDGSPFDAYFLTGGRGALFTLHHRPAAALEQSECFVIVPPFAEEMNRCRYMCTLFAQSLRGANYGILSVDLYGTGDSAGDFIDADWQQWRGDILQAIDHAKELGYAKVSLLAIRSGTLLAMEAVAQRSDCHRLIFWQPAISGDAIITQFLRIKLAASMERDEKGVTAADLKAEIANGNSIEVAGYDVSPGLFNGLKDSAVKSHLDICSLPIGWFTLVASEERKPPRPELKLIDEWRSRGAQIDHKICVGPAYWQAHERTLAPALIEATAEYVRHG